MAWHQGHPLLQTIFTSVHVYKLLSLEARSLDDVHFLEAQAALWNSVKLEPSTTDFRDLSAVVLRVYCMGVIASCQNVISKVTSGNPIYYEDEDISTNSFDLKLFTDINTNHVYDVVMELLNQTIIWLDRYEGAC